MKEFVIALLIFSGIGGAIVTVEKLFKKKDLIEKVIKEDVYFNYFLKIKNKKELCQISQEEEKMYQRLIVKNFYFYLLRYSFAYYAPALINSYKHIIQEEREKFLVASFIPAILFVESYGRANVKSPAGAYGIAQFIPSTARKYGLIRFEKGRIIDERGDPVKSIKSCASYLRDLYIIFGQYDFAIAAYHAGEGNIFRAISLYLKEFKNVYTSINSANVSRYVKKYHLSWSKIFFSAVPGTSLYNQLNSLRDYSSTYFFRVLSASYLLAKYEESPKNYEDLFYTYYGFKKKNQIWFDIIFDEITYLQNQKTVSVKLGSKIRNENDEVIVQFNLKNLSPYSESQNYQVLTHEDTYKFITILGYIHHYLHGRELEVTSLTRLVKDGASPYSFSNTGFCFRIKNNGEYLPFVLKRMKEWEFIDYQYYDDKKEYEILISPILRSRLAELNLKESQ